MAPADAPVFRAPLLPYRRSPRQSTGASSSMRIYIKKGGSISRVLYPFRDRRHLSCPWVAPWFRRGLPANRAKPVEGVAPGEQPFAAWPCSQRGLQMPSALPRTRWALAPPFHPYHDEGRFATFVSRNPRGFRGLEAAIPGCPGADRRHGGMFLLRCLSRKPGSPCGAFASVPGF